MKTHRNALILSLALAMLFSGPVSLLAQAPTSPQEFFGFQLGSDYKMARWDRIVEYFDRLESQSDRIRVINMGLTTEGNPFLAVIITSPGNFGRLDRLQLLNQQISDPRGLSQEQVEPSTTRTSSRS